MAYGELDRDALDRYITGGRYSSSCIWVTCGHCGENTAVFTETEYGSTTWSPEECSNKQCNKEFTGDEQWYEDEGPDDGEPPDFDD